MEQRLKYIDLGEAIMLLYVLVFHAVLSSFDLLNSQLSSIGDGVRQDLPDNRILFPFLMFFMPWFYYKAGMLFRIRPTREFFKYDMKKMLKPLLIWTLVAYIVFLFESLIQGGVTLRAMTYSVLRQYFLMGHLTTNSPLWFLLTLFFVRQIGNFSLKYCHPLAVALVGLLISYFCYKTDFRLMPLWVANTGCGLCFFSLGFNFTQYDCREIPKKKSVQMISAIVFVSWCIMSYFFSHQNQWQVPIVDMRSNESVQGIYLLSYPVCLIGIWVFNGLMKAIEDKGQFSFLNWVAHNAMQVYAIHGLVYSLLTWIILNYFYDMNPILMFCLTIALYGIMMLCIYPFSVRRKAVLQNPT